MNKRETNFVKKLFLAKELNIPLHSILGYKNKQTISYLWYTNLTSKECLTPEGLETFLESVLNLPQKDNALHNIKGLSEEVKLKYPSYKMYVTEVPKLIQKIKTELSNGLLEEDNLKEGLIISPEEQAFYEKLVLANVLYEMSRSARTGKPKVLFQDCIRLTHKESATVSNSWMIHLGGVLLTKYGFMAGMWELLTSIVGVTDYNTYSNYVVEKHRGLFNAKIEAGKRTGVYR